MSTGSMKRHPLWIGSEADRKENKMLTTKEAVDSYLEAHCLSLSQETVAWRGNILSRFATYCLVLPTEPEPIERFLVSLKSNCSDDSLRAYYHVLKTFYNFREKRYGEPNQMRLIKAPRCRKKELRVLGIAEQAMLLSVAKNDRDEAILTLLLDSMIRRGELASLRRQNISGNTIKVCGKTGERIVPISDSTARLLACIGHGDYLFIGRTGHPLTTRGIAEIVKKYLQGLGIKKKLGPHLLRHTAATQFIENGGNPLILQRILGHTTLNMTNRYVHLAMTTAITKEHEQFSPLRSVQHFIEQKELRTAAV